MLTTPLVTLVLVTRHYNYWLAAYVDTFHYANIKAIEYVGLGAHWLPQPQWRWLSKKATVSPRCRLFSCYRLESLQPSLRCFATTY